MKKFLATVTAVVLSLAMVALPAVSATAGSNDDRGQQTCDKVGYTKVTPEAASGSFAIYSGPTLVGNLTWSSGSVSYALQPGWSVDLCVKSGAKTGEDGDKLTYFGPLTLGGSTQAIAQDISHIGYKATYTPPAPTNVAVTATPTGEKCDGESGRLTLGSILVAITPGGGATVEYRKQGDVAWIALAANPITGLVGGTYEFQVTTATGYQLTTPSSFTVVVASDTSAACQEVQPTNVAVTATPTGEKCDGESGRLTLGSILVAITPGGGATVEYRKQGDVAWIALAANPITGLVGGTYEFQVTTAKGYQLTTPSSFTVVVPSDTSAACQEVQPTNVAVSATPTGEKCDGESGRLTLGSILVAITPGGGATVEYRKQGDVAWIALAANPITGLVGGTYEFQVTTAKGYQLTTPSSFTVVVPSDTSIGCDTLPVVVPSASQDPGCALPSFFTIGNDLSDPAAVTWTANGDPIAEGTHVVTGPIVITLVASANGPKYGFSGGTQTTWTFSFPSEETCGELTTLALTGAGDIASPALTLSALLGLLGAALVRSARTRRMGQRA